MLYIVERNWSSFDPTNHRISHYVNPRSLFEKATKVPLLTYVNTKLNCYTYWIKALTKKPSTLSYFKSRKKLSRMTDYIIFFWYSY
jgi:hypothetical protein